VSKAFFGELPGVPVGTAFESRKSLAAAGVHRPPMAGICGGASVGAESIVVNGGYIDDQDWGDELVYTGAGGNEPSTGRQIADQSFEHTPNAALVTSERGSLGSRGAGLQGRPGVQSTNGLSL
jgi:putative restriction endonuclease